jgi:hypothetical protein
LFPFELVYNNKTRSFYLLKEEECEKWVQAIKKCCGYSNLTDFYTLKEALGKGKFGLVKKGVHK